MARVWTFFSVLLAIGGILLFWSGVNRRFNRPLVSSNNSNKVTAVLAKADSSRIETNSASVAFDSNRSNIIVPMAADSSGRADSIFVLPQSNQSSPSAVISEPERPAVETKPKMQNISISLNDEEALKKRLLSILELQGWTTEELAQMQSLLMDPRAMFRYELLVRNSTFVETAEQYAHNLDAQAVDQCIRFWDSNREVINSALTSDGVQSEYILAILKVETNFGGFSGKESVFNVFWSLALGDAPEVQKAIVTPTDIPRAEMYRRMAKRALWARGQLRDLLYMARNGGENPVGIMGSYAGAFGLSQFIPSSYRAFGRDGNGDKVIDLDNLADAVASIDYYLRENGWPKIADKSRRRRAILTYNHSSFYADCVMALADSIAHRFAAKSQMTP